MVLKLFWKFLVFLCLLFFSSRLLVYNHSIFFSALLSSCYQSKSVPMITLSKRYIYINEKKALLKTWKMAVTESWLSVWKKKIVNRWESINLQITLPQYRRVRWVLCGCRRSCFALRLRFCGIEYFRVNKWTI